MSYFFFLEYRLIAFHAFILQRCGVTCSCAVFVDAWFRMHGNLIRLLRFRSTLAT